MPLINEKFFKLALKNIAQYGDTDVFPFPVENLIFYDDPVGAINVLKIIDKDFATAKERFPPVAVKSISAVGYSGFRWGTQIDPIWNAYLLSLVLSIGEDIEAKRVPASKNTVFAYRFEPDFSTGRIFNLKIGWVQFQEYSVVLARKFSYVLECDISDFYPRIYHHRLENALKKASSNSLVIQRIKDLLFLIADGVSYGLPVGGPAARLLSEILLNRIDRLLISDQVTYCRFVDDYHIFAKSREEAYRLLINLSELLLINEGLSLQRTKTRIMTSADFLASSDFAKENKPENASAEEAMAFSRIRLRYDPYSPTAEEDYEKLKKELRQFDIVGMLGRELAKSRIDESLTRRLIAAVRHLPLPTQNQAVSSLIQNLDVLYPIFPAVMILVKGVIQSLNKSTRQEVFSVIRELVFHQSYITQVPANLSYALRVLAYDESEETEALLAKLFKSPLNMMLKRDIILLMGHRGADHWISNCRKQFSVLTQWEKRAFIICSYILEDEGKHWREGIKKELWDFDKLVMKWAGDKKNSTGKAWRVPF